MGWYSWPKNKADQPTERDACSICGKPIRAGEKYMLSQDPNSREIVPEHAVCVWKQVEAEQAAKS